MLRPQDLIHKELKDAEMKLDWPGFGKEKPTLIISPPPAKQRARLLTKYVNGLTLQDDDRRFEPDFYQLGLACCTFVKDWEWGGEPFNAELLREIFESNVSVCSAFGQGVAQYFFDLDKTVEQQKKTAKKN
jgi:hypothetical protein